MAASACSRPVNSKLLRCVHSGCYNPFIWCKNKTVGDGVTAYEVQGQQLRLSFYFLSMSLRFMFHVECEIQYLHLITYEA